MPIDAVMNAVSAVKTRFGCDTDPPHRHVSHSAFIRVVIKTGLRRYAPVIFNIQIAQPGALAEVVEITV